MPDRLNSNNNQDLVDHDDISKYYLSEQVAEHNYVEDCWLSWLGNVYNLTPILLPKKGKKKRKKLKKRILLSSLK